MSAWVSPVCGLEYTMLSIFTASTRFSEGTGSPVNGDRSWRACDGAGACPQAASNAPAKPANTTTADTVMTALCLIQLIASSPAAHLTRMRDHTPWYYHPGGTGWAAGASLPSQASQEGQSVRYGDHVGRVQGRVVRSRPAPNSGLTVPGRAGVHGGR